MKTLSLDPKWIENLKTFLFISTSLAALIFAFIGGLAKFFDERAQLPDETQEKRGLWRLRKFYRVLARMVSYGGWDSAIDRSVSPARQIFTHALLRPDPRFAIGSQAASFPWPMLIAFTIGFSWGLYFIYAAIINSMDIWLVEGVLHLKGPLLVKNPDGSWSGELADVAALPLITFGFTIFSGAIWTRRDRAMADDHPEAS